MTKRDAPFTIGEWYHCYNHSIEKRVAFTDPQDYKRFLELLYLANDESPLRRNDIGIRPFEEILTLPRGTPLVSMGAFCLMPDHFHIVVKEVAAGGITTFMRKMGTAYTLYFNARHKRVGNLFLKPFQSRQVSTPRSLQQLVSYVHATPSVLYEPEWKVNHVVDPQFLEERLAAYPYSSLGAHANIPTPTDALVDADIFSVTCTVPFQKMLQEARQYTLLF